MRVELAKCIYRKAVDTWSKFYCLLFKKHLLLGFEDHVGNRKGNNEMFYTGLIP